MAKRSKCTCYTGCDDSEASSQPHQHSNDPCPEHPNAPVLPAHVTFLFECREALEAAKVALTVQAASKEECEAWGAEVVNLDDDQVYIAKGLTNSPGVFEYIVYSYVSTPGNREDPGETETIEHAHTGNALEAIRKAAVVIVETRINEWADVKADAAEARLVEETERLLGTSLPG